MVPNFRNIQLFRSQKSVKDLSLLDENVHFLDSIDNPEWFIDNQNVKILHAHHGNLGVLLLPFSLKGNVPLVCSFRGKDTIIQTEDYREQLKELFTHSATLFPVCHYLAERIIDLGCPQEKVKVLYGGIDLEKFNYSPPNEEKEHINILSVGRLVEKKGHHLLMRAYSKIKEKYPNTTLTIIGRGKYKEDLERLSIELKLGETFSLLDQIPYGEIPDWMSKADIFVAASLTGQDGDLEGIPNTLKEAMATGRPVVSTYHAGIPELVKNEQNGLLVQENNVNELAQAIEYMLEHKNTWHRLSVHARQTIEKDFNLKKQLVRQSFFYEQILNNLN